MSRSVGVPPPADGCPSPGDDGDPLSPDWDGLPACELGGVPCEPLEELGEPELCDGDPEL